MKNSNTNFVTDLIEDLNSNSRGKGLIELLSESPKDIDIYRQIKEKPEFYFELSGDGFSELTNQVRWQKWGQTNFFIEVTTTGRNFNKNVLDGLLTNNIIKTKLEALIPNVNLAEYKMVRKVGLTTKNGFMKADALLVKKMPDGSFDIILIENKLSGTTDYTIRQKEAWRILKTAPHEISVQYRIAGDGFEFFKDQKIVINPNRCIKINDHGSSTLNSITSGDINVIDFTPY